MAGLLDTPNDAALMQLGLGLLSAGGPSRMPVSFGQALGSAGMGATQAYRQAQEDQARNEMRKMQIEQGRFAMDEIQRRRMALEGLRNQLPEQMRPMFDANPDAVLKSMMREPEKPQLVTVAGPDGKPIQKWVRPGEASGVDIGPAAEKESALPWYVRRSPDGRTMIDPAYSDLERAKASAGRPVTPFYQAVATPQGVMSFDARSGRMVPISVDGEPVVKAADDPALQGKIAQAKQAGKTVGEETTKAALDYPRVVQNAETAIRLSDELLKHPGFSQAVGASSMLGIQKIPGTNAKDFMNRLDQIKGGAFLEAFNSLKGGGQITEVEGKKATDAIARMDNSTSEAEFKSAVSDFQKVVRAGMNRAKMKAKPVGEVAAPRPSSGVTFLGFE